MMKTLAALLLVFVITGLGSPLVRAETARYGQWQRTDRLQQMVDELGKLVRQAERSRAADRRFLSDLRDLLRRYDWPWRNKLLHDDFQDGDFYADPAWRVGEGAFRVDPRDGLIAELSRAPAPTPAPAAPQAAPPRKKNTGRDLALTLLGGLLNPQGTQNTAAAPRQAAPAPAPTFNDGATISTDLHIPNAFAVRLQLRAMARGGTLEIGVRQRLGGSGYRLILRGEDSGAQGALELVRVTRRGLSVVGGYYDRTELENGATHTLQWTRDARGKMAVSIDKKVVIDAVDTRLRDGFDSFTLEERTEPMAVREVTLWGR